MGKCQAFDYLCSTLNHLHNLPGSKSSPRLCILRKPSINGALILEWLNKSLLSRAKIGLLGLFVAHKVTFLISSFKEIILMFIQSRANPLMLQYNHPVSKITLGVVESKN